MTSLAVVGPSRLVSGSQDATLRLWDPQKQACLAVLRGHGDTVIALALLEDGRLVSCGCDATLRVWRTDAAG